MSNEIKAEIVVVTGLDEDAALLSVDSSWSEMIEEDIYDIGTYDWMAFNFDFEIPKQSVIYLNVIVEVGYWGSDVDEINYALIDDVVIDNESVSSILAKHKQNKGK